MFAAPLNLREDPFAAHYDPRFIVPTPGHTEALSTLVYAVEQREGWALLMGHPGVGKTTAISALLQELDDHVLPAVVSGASLNTSLAFINSLAAELSLPGPYGDKASFLADFKTLIKECHQQGKILLLVVDDVQFSNPELVEELSLLGNADHFSPRVLNIFLVGRPELMQFLNQPGAHSLRQQLRRFYLLPPMSREDTCRFVERRLGVAGGGRELFEAPALEALYQVSCGVPRRINQLAAWSLAKALEQGQDMVNAAAVAQVTQQAKATGVNLDEAATPVQMPPPPPTAPQSSQVALPRLGVEMQALEDSLAGRHHQDYCGLKWWERTTRFRLEWEGMRRRRLGVLNSGHAHYGPPWSQASWPHLDQARREADAAGARYDQWIRVQLECLTGSLADQPGPDHLHGPQAMAAYQDSLPSAETEPTDSTNGQFPDWALALLNPVEGAYQGQPQPSMTTSPPPAPPLEPKSGEVTPDPLPAVKGRPKTIV